MHIGLETFSDIAVGVNTRNGYRLVSYFETLTNAAFAPFKARGITSPSQLMFTKAERDSAPYSYSGQAFTNWPVSPDTEYVTLLGGAPPVSTSQVSGPLTGQTISLFVSPPANVRNVTGSIFVAAILPSSKGTDIYFMSNTGNWTPFSNGDTAPTAQQGQLYAGIGLHPVATPTDLSALKGASLYVGYGIDSTYANACTNMFNSSTYSPAYTVN